MTKFRREHDSVGEMDILENNNKNLSLYSVNSIVILFFVIIISSLHFHFGCLDIILIGNP